MGFSLKNSEGNARRRPEKLIILVFKTDDAIMILWQEQKLSYTSTSPPKRKRVKVAGCTARAQKNTGAKEARANAVNYLKNEIRSHSL